MRPGLHDDSVEIPLTIDVPMQYKELNKKRLGIGLLAIVGTWIGCIFGAVFFGSMSAGAYVFFAVIAIGVTFLVRRFYFNEKYYLKHMDDMLEHNYKYDCTQVWEIYEIAPKFPICHFKNGSKALFIMFDKDVIVGKSEDTQYYHYEAIANAYQMLSSKGIECMHIDYMDTVGKDSRFDPTVENMLKTKNQDLRQLLSVIFDYQTFCMSHAYSTYDVYAFYYKYDDAMFKDDIELIIGQFLSANYKRYRILQADGLRELVKSIYNLPDFSVVKACDDVFRGGNTAELIRVIWTECDGIRTVLNKTYEEQELEKQQRKGGSPLFRPSANNRGATVATASPAVASIPSGQNGGYFTNQASENDALIYDEDDIRDISFVAQTDFTGEVNDSMFTAEGAGFRMYDNTPQTSEQEAYEQGSVQGYSDNYAQQGQSYEQPNQGYSNDYSQQEPTYEQPVQEYSQPVDFTQQTPVVAEGGMTPSHTRRRRRGATAPVNQDTSELNPDNIQFGNQGVNQNPEYVGQAYSQTPDYTQQSYAETQPNEANFGATPSASDFGAVPNVNDFNTVPSAEDFGIVPDASDFSGGFESDSYESGVHPSAADFSYNPNVGVQPSAADFSGELESLMPNNAIGGSVSGTEITGVDDDDDELIDLFKED